MLNYDFPQLCTKCQGYKNMPYTWNSTMPPKMCTCISPTNSLSWECHRCGKINAPWKSSCDCTPPTNNFPYGNPIECVQSFNACYNDTYNLNKNFTDK